MQSPILQHKSELAYASKVRRKYRAMQKQAERQEGIDRRTAAERGYDACVKVGIARANSGSCIAAIVSGMTGEVRA